MPEEDLVSLIKNRPPDSTHISACARETTLDLKASLLEPMALAAARPSPVRSVKRPIRRGESASLTSLIIGSKRKLLLESRWGTNLIR